MKRTARPPAQRNILILMEWHDPLLRQGIGAYAREHNWHLTIDECASIPRGWQGDGVLTVFHRRRDMARYLRGLSVPVVDLGLYRPDLPLPRVAGDHARIGALAADHFADRGFRQAAWFSTSDTPVHRLRRRGFQEAWTKRGLPHPPAWIWAEVCAQAPDDWKRMRQWLERRLTKAPKPLAVFAYNDYDASKVQDVCRAAGLAVPQEVAILGVDNNELICLNQPVPLSSIAHDLPRVGYEGAALLDRLIDGAPAPDAPLLVAPTAVVLRQSTDLTAIEHPVIRKAMGFIRQNLSRSFGVEEAAAAAGVSRSTLDRLFLQHLHLSAHEVVRRTRIEAVKHLLVHTKLPLSDIARQTGFCHAQHLRQAFRRAEGMTPQAFRAPSALASK